MMKTIDKLPTKSFQGGSTIRFGLLPFLLFILLVLTLSAPLAFPQANTNPSVEAAIKQTVLVRAVMCSAVENVCPINPAIVFSIELGSVSCFALFDPVQQETVIYQKWYHKNKLSTTQRLTLKPPRWATFNTVQLRATDKGPWRVEITDQSNNILQILRFSIVD
jgi:hypothetical protein